MDMFAKLAHLKRAVDQTVNQTLIPGSSSGVGQPQLSHPGPCLRARTAAQTLPTIPGISQACKRRLNKKLI